MKQVTGPTRQRIIDMQYLEPAQRVGCFCCKFSKSETANSRLRCTNGRPYFTVNKMGWCPSFKRQ